MFSKKPARSSLQFESLERRLLLACVPVGDTLIECEGSRGPGTPESEWFRSLAPSRSVEGYTSETSYAPGETLQLHVSTSPPRNYRVEIFRLGWYAGDGARRVACLPDCGGGVISGSDQGVPVPDPVTKEVDAGWAVTDAFVVPSDWESGYYLASLILTDGADAGAAHFVPFIVRAPDAQNSSILLEVPVNTWQAYNRWGGHSLYDPDAADKVSFERPYDNIQDVFRYEYQLVRYLEREGFDVEYATNVDVHRNPSVLLDHSLVISSGHDEYWSREMRDGFEAARDSGVNLAFFASNTAYWQVRYEDAEQTLVGYKVKPPNAGDDPEPDPANKSMRFRELTPPRPECELLGVQYMATHTAGFSRAEDQYADFTVNPGELGDAWFTGTGIQAGDSFPNRVGYEWDQIVPGCRTESPTVLMQYLSGDGRDAHMTRYQTASGARVVSTGSMAFSYGLDDWRFNTSAVTPADPRLQSFVRNVLTDLGGGRAAYRQPDDTNGLVDIEAEFFHRRIGQGGHDWVATAELGASSSTAMLASPDSGDNRASDYVTTSPRLDYDIEFAKTGTHYVWILGRAAGSTAPSSDSVHVGFDGAAIISGERIQGFTENYDWSTNLSSGSRATVEVATSGLHTLNVWMREDGFALDRIVLTTNPSFDLPSILNPPASFAQSTDGNGLVVIEAEAYDQRLPRGNHDWNTVSDAGASGGQAAQAGPDTGANIASDYAASSPQLNYSIDFVETGTHYIWILGRAGGSTAASSDSLHAGLDGLEVLSAQRIQNFDANFGWSTTVSGGSRAMLNVPSVGRHDFNLWMREDGFVADRIVLTTNPTLDVESLLSSGNVVPSFFQSNDGRGIVDMEAEAYDATSTVNGKSWSPVNDPAASGSFAMRAGPETGDNVASNFSINSPRLDYHIDFAEIGTHYVWILGRAAGATIGSSDSVHAGLDGQEIPSATRIQGFEDSYQWSGTIASGARTVVDVPTVGVHTFNVWMREDGFAIDRILLTTDPTTDIASLLGAVVGSGEGTTTMPLSSTGQWAPVIPPASVPNATDIALLQSFEVADTNRDGLVSAIDALLVINQLNRQSDLSAPPLERPLQFDLNDDGLLSAIDALLVINLITLQANSPEAEWAYWDGFHVRRTH